AVKAGQGGLGDNAHPADLGVAVHDTSTLGGSVGGFPLGGASDPATVTYEFFTTNDCTGSHTDQTVNVAADGSVPNADPQTLGAGSYSHPALDSGNGNYTGKTAAGEPLKVNKAHLAVTTKVHAADHVDVTGKTIGLGSVLHDVAHVTGAVGGFAPHGGVTFVLYSLPNCQGTGQVV